MIKLVKPLTNLYRLWRQTGSIEMAYRLLPKYVTSGIGDRAVRSSGAFRFSNHGKSLNRRQLALFEGDGELLASFISHPTARFSGKTDDGETVSVECNGREIRLTAADHQSLKVVQEVFIDNLYDFHGNGRRYVVMDIGMNIGAASLFFASHPNVKRVYAYEPFPLTRKAAERNLAMNPDLSSKVDMLGYGLGSNDETKSVPEPAAGLLGGTTTDFMLEAAEPDTGKRGTVEVEIRDIREEFDRVVSLHPDCELILKMDCEGAEYEIFQALESSDRLGRAERLMIEYHLKGKDMLTSGLRRAEFEVISPNSGLTGTCDMLYAFKRS